MAAKRVADIEAVINLKIEGDEAVQSKITQLENATKKVSTDGIVYQMKINEKDYVNVAKKINEISASGNKIILEFDKKAFAKNFDGASKEVKSKLKVMQDAIQTTMNIINTSQGSYDISGMLSYYDQQIKKATELANKLTKVREAQSEFGKEQIKDSYKAYAKNKSADNKAKFVTAYEEYGSELDKDFSFKFKIDEASIKKSLSDIKKEYEAVSDEIYNGDMDFSNSLDKAVEQIEVKYEKLQEKAKSLREELNNITTETEKVSEKKVNEINKKENKKKPESKAETKAKTPTTKDGGGTIERISEIKITPINLSEFYEKIETFRQANIEITASNKEKFYEDLENSVVSLKIKPEQVENIDDSPSLKNTTEGVKQLVSSIRTIGEEFKNATETISTNSEKQINSIKEIAQTINNVNTKTGKKNQDKQNDKLFKLSEKQLYAQEKKLLSATKDLDLSKFVDKNLNITGKDGITEITTLTSRLEYLQQAAKETLSTLRNTEYVDKDSMSQAIVDYQRLIDEINQLDVAQNKIKDPIFLNEKQLYAQEKKLLSATKDLDLSNLKNQQVSFDDNTGVTQITTLSQRLRDLQVQARSTFENLKNAEFVDKEEMSEATNAYQKLIDEINQLNTAQNKITNDSGAYKGTFLNNLNLNSRLKQTSQAEIERLLKAELLKNNGSVKNLSYSPGANKATADVINDGYIKRMTISLNEYQDALGKTQVEVRTLSGAEKEYASMGSKWMSGFKSKVNSLTQYITGLEVVMRGWQELKEGFNFVKELDSQLTTINQTMSATSDELKNLGNSSIDVGKQLGADVTDVVDAVAIYANANETAKSILKKAEPTVLLSNASGADTSTASDQIQGVVQQFEELEGQERRIVNSYEKISAGLAIDFATGINRMAEGVQTAGSIASEAGLQFETFSAIVGKVSERTRQEGSQIGNAINFVALVV